jgi:hypothetical protein
MTKFWLVRVRLNNGGYDRRGQYYGVGRRVYLAQCDDVNEGDAWEFRADSREDAKAVVLRRYPAATFYR